MTELATHGTIRLGQLINVDRLAVVFAPKSVNVQEGGHFMDFILQVPALLSSIGGFIIALATAALIKKIGDYIDKIQP